MRASVLLSGCLTLAVVNIACAEEDNSAEASPALVNEVTSTAELTADDRLSHLVETIVREAIPRQFENDKHWNKRTKVVNGLDIETKRGLPRISKRERAVRHGFWRRYQVTLINPQETLHLRIDNLRSPSAGEFRWDLFVSMRANVEARFEHWNLGVKLLNGSTNADATLNVHADCSLKISLEADAESSLPVVVLRPTVHTIHLTLPDIDVHKFGKVEGPVVREIGSGLEDIIEELLQSQEKSVLKQAQKSIDKHEDDLRIPLPEFLTSRWSALWKTP